MLFILLFILVVNVVVNYVQRNSIESNKFCSVPSKHVFRRPFTILPKQKDSQVGGEYCLLISCLPLPPCKRCSGHHVEVYRVFSIYIVGYTESLLEVGMHAVKNKTVSILCLTFLHSIVHVAKGL